VSVCIAAVRSSARICPQRMLVTGPPKMPWLSLPEYGSKAYVSSISREWNATPAIHRAVFFSEYAVLVERYSSRRITDPRYSLKKRRFRYCSRPSRENGERKRGWNQQCQQYECPGHGNGIGPHQTLYGRPEPFLNLALMCQPPATQSVHLAREGHEHLPGWPGCWYRCGTHGNKGLNRIMQTRVCATPLDRYQ